MNVDQERQSLVNERSAIRVRAERVKNEERRDRGFRQTARPAEHDAEKQPSHPDQVRVQLWRKDIMLHFLASNAFMHLTT
jgi:hypothetical protein